MIGKTSYNTSNSFQKGFQTLNQNLTRSNATLTQRLNAQQIEIDLLQEQVNAMDSSTTEFMVASKVSLGLDKVDNTSDENKELSKKARDALDLKHPLIQDSIIDGKDQRLPQSHVQGLVSALEGKQPSITTSAKISMDKISDPYFANIKTSSTDSTTLATALVNIPSSSIITSATGVTPKVTLDTTLGTFHPKIENADNKRLAQNCVESLVSDLSKKQNLLSATNKLEKTKIETYYFADIQKDSNDTTTLATVLNQSPTIFIGGSSGATNWSNLDYSIGSIISVQLAITNITTSNQFTVNLLNTLPSGSWSGCVQFIFTKTSTNYSFTITNPIRLQVNFAGAKTSGDFFPSENNHQGSYVTNSNTQVWQMNLPVLFRCAAGRASNQLQVFLTVPNTPSTTNPVPTSGYLTHQITLSLVKIAL